MSGGGGRIRRVHAEQVLSAITPLLDAGRVPGAVVGLRHEGRVTVAAGGTTAPGGGDRLPADCVVRIASNTKPMIAALTMVLVQDGVLALDKPVERHLPELALRRVLRRVDGPLDDTVAAHRPVTVEDLLTMRMGFGWVFEADSPAFAAAADLGLGFGPPDPTGQPAPDEWIARFATLPLLEQPGRVWRYELAFAVLGVLLARATGQPLATLLAERLFDPLGMTATGFTADPARLVPAFVRDGDALVPFDGVTDSRWLAPPRFPDARGGLVSTAADLLRFAGMLLDGGDGLLTAASVAAMTTDQLTAEQRRGPSAATFLDSGGWGYGVGVTERPVGRRYGWAGGLGTLWYSWPDHGLAAVLLTQVTPPTADVFEAFTGSVEGMLARGRR